VTDRSSEMLALYQQHRFEDQLRFYRDRRELFDRAAGQAAVVLAVLLGLSAAVSALAGASTSHTRLWAALAAILPAITTALAAYGALYAFEQQSKLYGDASRALVAVQRELPDLARLPDDQARAAAVRDYVEKVESVFKKEQGQWGQLTSSIEIRETAKP
jgi:SMODS and SLOG-associating 2TM effector domain 1